MELIKPKHIFNNLTVEEILRNTIYEEYVPNLKINGILNLKDIVVHKNNNTLSDKIKKSIDNDIHRLKVIELFDKKMENSYGIYMTIYCLFLGVVMYYIYKIGWFDDIVELFKQIEFKH